MKPHRETYPEQYTHEWCGKQVQVVLPNRTIIGTFERVMQSRFGPLVIITEVGPKEAYSLKDVHLMP